MMKIVFAFCAAAFALCAAEYEDGIQPVAVYVPQVKVYTVETPQVNVIKVFGQTVELPSIADYRTVRVSSANLPEVIKHVVTVPEVEVKVTSAGMVYVPSPQGAVIVVPSAGGEVIAIPTVTGYKIVVPEVSDPAARMPQIIALQKIQQTLFRDQRNLMYDSSIGIDSAVWMRWIAHYQKNEPFDLQYIKLQNGLRMIAEVNAPADAKERETVCANLEKYASAGYNAALLTFSLSDPSDPSDSSDLSDLLAIAELIRSKGLAVWIAYSGPENLRHSVFADPDKLTRYISALAAKSEGIILGWRRTSVHQFIADAPFNNLILKAARTANPQIQVLGESYIGETAETPEYTRVMTTNNPPNISGTIISGIGFYGVNIAGALNGVFAPVAKMDRVALIVGSKPYHMSLHKTGHSRAEQDAIKQNLERKFRAAGCIGTITLHGDGGTLEKKITDSLCR